MMEWNRIECLAVLVMSAMFTAVAVVAEEGGEAAAPAAAAAPAPAATPATGASEASVMIEDFEADLKKVPEVKTGWESNEGPSSKASLTRVGDAKDGTGAGQIGFDVKPGSWALVQKKVEGAEWLNQKPKAVSFWLRGSGSGKMTVELEESYTYKWRKEVSLTDRTWHFVKINFKEFACDDKKEMSPADLVMVKFVSHGGSAKILVDDIQFEFEE